MKLPDTCDLPVIPVLPALADALRLHRRAVLTAAPGAGKTTAVPPFLLTELYHNAGRIIMLEPRRIAARAAAARISALTGDSLGGTTGYRVRGEARVSSRTRIEIVTEGMLTGMLQQDPELSGVSLLIFDEFHERNLNSDLALALALDCAGALRPDLHILVMSATLDAGPVAGLLETPAVISAPGRMFPVTEHWGKPFGDIRELPERTAGAIRRIYEAETGSILVFLPGAREIQRTRELLKDISGGGCRIEMLYGTLDKEAQERAVAPAPEGCRKIVLSTNIAESSLTIGGIRVVVDSGYERTVKFDPASSMSRLETCRISKASAAQRAGRAGRLEPGAVYRLYSQQDYLRMQDAPQPEIMEAELSNFVLELAQWGSGAGELKWLNPPPPAKLSAAVKLLTQLNALDGNGRLTVHGRRLAKLPVHPRVAAMLVFAGEHGLVPLACELAALLEERSINTGGNADICTALEIWRSSRQKYRQLNVIRDQLLKIMQCDYRQQDSSPAGVLLAQAYGEWIAKSRGVPGVNYLLSSGKGARLHESDDMRRHEFLAAAAVDGSAQGMIRLAAPLTMQEINKFFASAVTRETAVRFDRARNRVCGVRETRLGAIVLKSEPVSGINAAEKTGVLAQAVRDAGLHVLGLSGKAAELLDRLRFAAGYSPDIYPCLTEENMPDKLEELLSFIPDAVSFDDLRKADWHGVISAWAGYQTLARLEAEFPERLTVPTGSKIKIDYSGDTPSLPVRVQELYGLKKHPALGDGRLLLKLNLLSPAHRTIQITTDLPEFWKTNWALVRKEMRAQYPKHIWPEDPAGAAPTTKAKPRKEG